MGDSAWEPLQGLGQPANLCAGGALGTLLPGEGRSSLVLQPLADSQKSPFCEMVHGRHGEGGILRGQSTCLACKSQLQSLAPMGRTGKGHAREGRSQSEQTVLSKRKHSRQLLPCRCSNNALHQQHQHLCCTFDGSFPYGPKGSFVCCILFALHNGFLSSLHFHTSIW